MEEKVLTNILDQHQKWQQIQSARPKWLQKWHVNSTDKLKSTGLPSKKWEAWRFTDLKPFYKNDLKMLKSENDNHLQKIVEKYQLLPNLIVVCNGVYVEELSKLSCGPQVEVIPFEKIIKKDEGQELHQFLKQFSGKDERIH